MHELLLTCAGPLEGGFSPLFQQGVMLPASAGTSLTEFLQCVLEISPEYLERRVQTVFLDGRPVDDPNAAVIGPGSVVALSAPLPGLAGASMRKGGRYACLRSSISHREGSGSGRGSQPGLVTLKLFNLLIAELGPALLVRGVRIPATLLLDLLGSRGLPDHCVRMEVDGCTMDQDQLAGHLASWKEELVDLRIDRTLPPQEVPCRQ
jgi:hypothetical protein